jgi:16S rRNA (cytosine1402-N4)-methyltransferase
MVEPTHIPVLVTEVLEHLVERPEQTSRGAGRQPEERLYIDGTVGQGGHAQALLEHCLPGCRLLGFDRDPVNLSVARQRLERFSDCLVLVQDSYANARRHAYAHGFSQVDGIILDLGFSSYHIEDPARGFSFQSEGPLDMRYDQRQELTAEMIVNGWSQDDLAHIFRVYGEEPAARVVAKAIYDARKKTRITTTLQLAELVASVIRRRAGTPLKSPLAKGGRRIHPATRVFQALRLAVNDELGELERALPALLELLRHGGRLAVISFHSLEDRIVKKFFQSQDGQTVRLINKRVITPSQEEIRRNPRSRSAKLRVAERI